MPSLPPSPTRSTFEPTTRRADSAPFFQYDDQDSFYHSRKSSADIEASCLVPSDPTDSTMSDLPPSPSKKTRRNTYPDPHGWFEFRKTPLLPIAENPKATAERKFERRLAAGSWCAMLALLLLTIYFLMRET
ncbi:hypothetical protein MSAN_00901800 [Mycena sanguinolenta]|uniref:Uncharacterized protein n=1 Tax=Mycena sanguinolenta TaxID=230812 RepID=A0A8H7DBY3_9AGAR|nr:hypothetical protein MSAN_00901800 [Mycena sanguinolenta]